MVKTDNSKTTKKKEKKTGTGCKSNRKKRPGGRGKRSLERRVPGLDQNTEL